MILLLEPDIRWENEYREMISAWHASGETPEPWVLREDCSDFDRMVRTLKAYSRGKGVPEGFVPNSTFWAYNGETEKITGAVNIRHMLEGEFLRVWGNIGFGVRPDERKQGCATAILHLALEECKKLHLSKVLLACYQENIASAKTILKNGGKLENEITEKGTGKIIQRYWIYLY